MEIIETVVGQIGAVVGLETTQIAFAIDRNRPIFLIRLFYERASS